MRPVFKFKKLIATAVFAVLPIVGFGQIIDFYIEGDSDPSGFEVAATGQVDFSAWDLGYLQVRITNTSPVSSDPSFISAFYLRRPVDGQGASVTGESLLGSPDSVPGTWDMTTSFNDGHGNITSVWDGDTLDYADYMGATVPVPTDHSDRLYREDPAPAIFTWQFDSPPDISVDDWLAIDAPLLFVRWQGISLQDESAKTYGGGDRPFEPGVVPEPSEIAFLSIIGLGGLLFVRRRLTGKK
jgi:hypothetical protein